ncbi:flagellar biosynthesis protein FlhB [Desulfolucanica intricata]|uniref:flagellar biosynthesis protein FlhB n=1 Tax=Desulfolucanica intricata TaxID=1285191 RepID=UPI00082C3356|nr:flagellar biosynthesis protein FlhB [Desulfolucanica intricata]
MARGSQEKTEKATPRKIAEARRKGQVAKSADLNGAVGLLAMVLLLYAIEDHHINSLYRYLTEFFQHFTEYNSEQADFLHVMIDVASYFFGLMAPFFILAVVVGLAVNLTQTGFIFAPGVIKPKADRINPIEGFKRIFSVRSLFELAKSLLKVIIIGGVTYSLVAGSISDLMMIFYVTPHMILQQFSGFTLRVFLWGGLAYLALALIDFLYQRYEYQKNLRMSKQELKDELKQTEGDPLLKSKRREMQRQITLNRIIQEVPRATVIITNPTHLAVAVRYQEAENDAPQVVAKGADNLALRIREIAKENKIPVVEQKELARLLYTQVEVGQEIPYEFYQAVAEILALVYRKKNGYL